MGPKLLYWADASLRPTRAPEIIEKIHDVCGGGQNAGLDSGLLVFGQLGPGPRFSQLRDRSLSSPFTEVRPRPGLHDLCDSGTEVSARLFSSCSEQSLLQPAAALTP